MVNYDFSRYCNNCRLLALCKSSELSNCESLSSGYINIGYLYV